MSKTDTAQTAPAAERQDTPYRAAVTHMADLGPGLRLLTLTVKKEAEQKPSPFHWEAGQYVWIKFGGFSPRAYSIASPPNKDGRLEIHIKDSGAGGASTYALHRLKPGESAWLSAPAGESVYRPDRHRNNQLLLIAGGIGIAPLWAITRHALSDPDRKEKIYLYWGVRSEKSLYYKDRLEALAMTDNRFIFVPVIGDKVGEIASEALPDLQDHIIYLSGPGAMIDATLPLLKARAARDEAVFYDKLS